jgi:hypothetical protein
VKRSAEYDLLFEALRPPGDAARTVDLDAIDADKLVFLAYWHRLGPLLYSHLESRGAELPGAAGDALRRAYLANAAGAMVRLAARDRILTGLAERGIPVMPLKGAALLELVYPDPAVREMSDLDILVPRERMDEANGLLTELGYGRKRPVAREQDTLEWMRANHRHDPVVVDEQKLVAVELHHHIVKGEPALHFDIGGYWERARPSATGAHVLPSSEDLLLHVCIHFTYHRKSRSNGALAQIGDIAWIVDREGVDWDVLAELARGYRLDTFVFLALFTARELGVALPAGPLDALRPAGFEPAVGRRMVELRVLRTAARGPLHSVRKTVAPSRYVLERSGGANPRNPLSLAWAYLRRVGKGLRFWRYFVREPRKLLQDYRLNGQLEAIERSASGGDKQARTT